VNYRHHIHAGNFADVFKHIFRSRVLLRLGAKLTAIRFIETHAGSGIQELFGREAGKTSEWRGGRLPKLATARREASIAAALPDEAKTIGRNAFDVAARNRQIL
jgi:23S rRNA (adenine2030-N6)-methyltransferase